MSDLPANATLTLSDEEIGVVITALDEFRFNANEKILMETMLEEDELDLATQIEVAGRVMLMLGVDDSLPEPCDQSFEEGGDA